MTPQEQAQADARMLKALQRTTRIFIDFRAIATGEMFALDADIDRMVEEACEGLRLLPPEERLNFLEHSIVHLNALFAKFGRDHGDLIAQARGELARSESPTQPDAAQPGG